jgi:hypothetical protein
MEGLGIWPDVTGVVHRPSHRCEFEAVVEDPAERGFRVGIGVGVGAMHDARNHLDALRVSRHETSMEDVPQDITETMGKIKAARARPKQSRGSGGGDERLKTKFTAAAGMVLALWAIWTAPGVSQAVQAGHVTGFPRAQVSPWW